MKVVNSSRRQIVMAVLLCLATIGAVMRYTTDASSVWHNIGTLLLVMWLPAVGNLVGFVIGKLPARKQRQQDFDPASPFTPHLLARLRPIAPANGTPPVFDAAECRCTLIVGHQGFTARSAQPLLAGLASVAEGKTATLEFELLRPSVALAALCPEVALHVLMGSQAVASGHVA